MLRYLINASQERKSLSRLYNKFRPTYIIQYWIYPSESYLLCPSMLYSVLSLSYRMQPIPLFLALLVGQRQKLFYKK